MSRNRAEVLQLLYDVDSWGHRSYLPAAIDYDAARAQFDELTSRLETSFGCSTVENPHVVQDTALLDYMGLPVEATGASDIVWVLISNFSPLAMYHVGRVNPGGTARVEDQLSAEVRARIEDALSDTGYRVIPNDVLWEPYDGMHERIRRVNYSWFTRYFDHH